VSQKSPTYWVRSRQINEAGQSSGRPVPAKFETLEEAQLYRRQLTFHKGPYHPGYFVEVEEDIPLTFTFTPETGRS
jgi:hypothetical protein